MSASTTRVALLGHVLEKEPLPWEKKNEPTVTKRIAWPGGKIVSNKEEAMRKFYLRKIEAGNMTDEQLKRLEQTMLSKGVEPSVGITDSNFPKTELNGKRKRNTPKRSNTKRTTTNSNCSNTSTIVLKNQSSTSNAKFSKYKGKKLPNKKGNVRKFKAKKKERKKAIDLNDKLNMSLDSIMNR